MMKSAISLLLCSAGVLSTKSFNDALQERARTAWTKRLLQDGGIIEDIEGAPRFDDLELSPACLAGILGFKDNDDYREGYESFLADQVPCLNESIGDIALPPGEDIALPPPCPDEIDEFEPVCERAGGLVCIFRVGASASVSVGGIELPIGATSFQVGVADCLPDTCNRDDFDLSFDAFDEQFNFLTDILDVVEFEFFYRIYCSAEDNLPRQFGPGIATETKITGSVDSATTFELACSSCTPAWSVDFEADPQDVGELTGRDIANIAIDALYKNVDFLRSGCLAAYKPNDENFNIFCPKENAGTGVITLSEDDGEARDLTDFEGEQLTLVGQQMDFVTEITHTVSTNAAGTAASPTLLSVSMLSLLAISSAATLEL